MDKIEKRWPAMRDRKGTMQGIEAAKQDYTVGLSSRICQPYLHDQTSKPPATDTGGKIQPCNLPTYS